MFVVHVYTNHSGVLYLFKVLEFNEKESATEYGNEMLEQGFSVEVYQRIVF